MTQATGRLRDPGIGWRVLLDVAAPVEPDRWASVCERIGWPAAPIGPADPVVLAQAHEAPARLGLDAQRAVVSVHHDACDGLGLVRLLAALLEQPITSDARGVGDRPAATSALARRLREVAIAPPARLATPGRSASGGSASGDVFAHREVPDVVRTADLVYAVSRIVPRARHVAVAIGASRAPEATTIADHSALLRLTDVETMSRETIGAALRTAPLQPTSTALPGPVAGLALRMLAPRLGSTFLVSHLGVVSGAPALRFYPVTAGGTGLSLGAVTQDGTTTLTLRARANRWNADGLQRLLEAVATELGELRPR